MENLLLHYSNTIPIPFRYISNETGKRWENNEMKFCMNGIEDNTQETYGLKTLNYPPKIREAVTFEKDLRNLANRLRCRKAKATSRDS